MNQLHTLEHHNYDLLLGHKNPMAVRLNDATHQNVRVGDLVQFSGHNTIMDRQRFQVVGKTEHPTIHSAMETIKHSNLGARDKINMTNSFLGVHGPSSTSHPVVSMHLAPHPMPSSMNHSVGGLG